MTRTWAAVLAAAVLVVAGCSGDGDGGGDEPSSEPTAGPERYVALGDSFTAAPGVPPQMGGACGRSRSNYPSVVARAEGLRLTDVSCSAATSRDLLDLQLRAVTADTSLVTVSIGGNDDGLFGRLVGSCAFGRCDRGIHVATALRHIRRNVGEVLDAVAAAAPDAQVIVVSYPRLLPASGACPDLVPFARSDYAFVNRVNRGLVDAQRTAAEAAGVEFADTYAASEGHDICADEPWVNGSRTAPDGTIPFHPFAVGEAGMAAVVQELLES